MFCDQSLQKFLQSFVCNKAKGRISKRKEQEKKARKIFQKTIISYPLVSRGTCAYQGIRTARFRENLECFVFLLLTLWDLYFCLITEGLIPLHLLTPTDTVKILHYFYNSSYPILDWWLIFSEYSTKYFQCFNSKFSNWAWLGFLSSWIAFSEIRGFFPGWNLE